MCPLLAHACSVLRFAFIPLLMLFYVLVLFVQHGVLLVCGLGSLPLHHGGRRDSQRSPRGIFLFLVLVDATAILTEAVHRQVLCPLPLRGAGGAGGGGLRRVGSGRECVRQQQRSRSRGGWGWGRRRGAGSRLLLGGWPAATERWLDSTGQVRYPLLFVHQSMVKIGIQKPFL